MENRTSEIRRCIGSPMADKRPKFRNSSWLSSSYVCDVIKKLELEEQLKASSAVRHLLKHLLGEAEKNTKAILAASVGKVLIIDEVCIYIWLASTLALTLFDAR